MPHPSEHARTTPEKTAILMARSGERVSFGTFEERTNQGAQLFRALGLKAGDHVAFCLENTPRMLEMAYAAQRSGIYYTPISSRLTAGEVAYIIEDCGARTFLSSPALGDVASALRPMLKSSVHAFSAGGPLPGYQDWESALAAQPKTPIADQTYGWPMFYSSGTTGRPKGITRIIPEMPFDAPLPADEIGKRQYEWRKDLVYLSPAPLYHAAPLVFTMAALKYGGTVILMEHFDAEEALALIEKHNVTHSQWVPTMFVRMLKLPDDARRRHDLSSHEVAIHAAAPCPVPVKHEMIRWWGPILVEYYAGSEGNGSTFITSEDWLKRPGSVGRPMAAKIHILDENMNEQPPGEAGTIYFEGGGQFAYHNAPEKTAESHSPEGWSTLGDVGFLDAEGYLYLTDRKAFMIISGGVNIYPQEAENILITHPQVADVAVIGVPNEEFGEEVKAVIQPQNWAEAGPALAEELIAHCRRHLSAIKCPRTIDFEKELPRHPTGKLYKRLIRDRYWGKRDSKIV